MDGWMEGGTRGSSAVLVLPWGEGVGLGWGIPQSLWEVSLSWDGDGKGLVSRFLAGRCHC